jgi:hypothetical protein
MCCIPIRKTNALSSWLWNPSGFSFTGDNKLTFEWVGKWSWYLEICVWNCLLAIMAARPSVCSIRLLVKSRVNNNNPYTLGCLSCVTTQYYFTEIYWGNDVPMKVIVFLSEKNLDSKYTDNGILFKNKHLELMVNRNRCKNRT